MGSKQKQTRQLQLEHFKQLIANRKALLTEKGIEENYIQNDKVIKHFQAGLERTLRAITSITSRERLMENVKLQKQKRAEKMVAATEKTKGKTKQEKGSNMK